MEKNNILQIIKLLSDKGLKKKKYLQSLQLSAAHIIENEQKHCLKL